MAKKTASDSGVACAANKHGMTGALGHIVWNYHERIDRGHGVITQWIKRDKVSIFAQARLERSLDQLRSMPKTSWSKPAPASSLGHHTYVIRFKDVGNVQLRVFGHFYDAHSSFVMTLNGNERDNVYYPKNYAELTERHKASCNQNFSDNTTKFGDYCDLCEPGWVRVS